MKYNGKIIGYLIVVELLLLIYNKDFVFNLLKSWEEVVELDVKLKKEGKLVIMWNLKEFYFIWFLMVVDGGYVFKYGVDGYDVKDVGINNKGVKDVMNFVKGFVDKGVIFLDMDYLVFEFVFN